MATATKTRRQIVGLKLKGAAGVDHGANAAQMGGAEGWMVLKSDGTQLELTETSPGHFVAKTKEADMADPTAAELAEQLAKAQADLATVSAELEKAKAKKPGNAAEDALDGGKDDDEEVKKALETSPVLKAWADKLAADAASAQTAAAAASEVAKAERDARVAREWVAKAAEFSGLPTTPENFGPVLRSVYEAADAAKAPAIYNELDRVLRAASEQAKAAELLKEVGTNHRTGGDAWGAIEKAAEDLRVDAAKAGETLTKEQSIDRITQLRPELMAAYKKERS